MNNPAFLESWKKGITLADADTLFYGTGQHMNMESHINKLQPKVANIHKSIKNYPKSKAVWLAVMVGFFNPEEGDKLAKKVGAVGIGNLVLTLDNEHRHAFNNLVNHYQGW